MLVGVTARQWLNRDKQERYERELALFIDEIEGQPPYRAVLIPQVTSNYLADDDRIVEARIADLCRTEPIRIDESLSHHDLKNLYGSCHYLVGTRFHSVIFALTSCVPCIAIEYEHKTRGIMRDLGLAEWVLPIEEVTSNRLIEMACRLEADKVGYMRTLSPSLAECVTRAENVVGVLKTVYKAERRRQAATVEKRNP
jgi:colanic acid/amylovoran biosynthesis protein